MDALPLSFHQKYCKRKPWWSTENSFTSSSIVTGKISNPTFTSLVNTDVSSNDFLSDLSFVYQKYGGRISYTPRSSWRKTRISNVSYDRKSIGHLQIRFLLYSRSSVSLLAIQWLDPGFDDSRFTEADNTHLGGRGISTHGVCRFVGRELRR